MKFTDFEYKRPDFETVERQLDELTGQLAKAENKEELLKVFFEIEKIQSHIDTMSTLCAIRHSINTKDEFYRQETDFWDEKGPELEVYTNRIGHILYNCPFRDELYDVIPEVFTEII